ncbi:hypothetical protein JOB18_008742 [Solea senegalensis]|uniref:Uncharacterized protein n=1 Tax=Solea senegalensis TaxID=28829 RepID=A0AAV6QA81_SOLSE|nr:uncharacterized protein LOC122770895 isoform X2 [Solea senegalensis]KAG7485363.1 hypothetical protein JOB18_008742 [Solea senegalensis]
MDFTTVVTVSALLLVVVAAAAVGADEAELEPNTGNTTTVPTNNSYDDSTRPEPIDSSRSNNEEPPRPTPVLGFLSVSWKSRCKGHLMFYHDSTSSHVCHESKTTVQSLSGNVCEKRRGCKDLLSWHNGSHEANGYHVSEDGVQLRSSCEVLEVRCEVETDKGVADVHGRQLQVYKVVTALLCCVLLVLLLIRFTRPTVKALQKRLSDRRQSRWIGPTQSHSVSYHRGKSAVKNNDKEQRLSYPALERLTLSDSREPSSSRNSVCIF